MKKLFLPLACLLVMMGSASTLFHQFGSYMRASIIAEGTSPLAVETWIEWVSLLFFAIAIFLLRNVNFKKIFRSSLLTIALLTISSICVFPNASTSYALTSYFIVKMFCYKSLIVLGWAYVNQITAQTEGIKYYFALNFIAYWIVVPFALIQTALILACPNMHAYTLFLTVIILVVLGLAWLCDRWISKRSTDLIPPERKPLSSSTKWISIFSLAGFVSGIFLMMNLNQISIGSHFKTYAPTPVDFHTLLARFSMTAGIGSFALSIISIFIGPRLLQNKGWKFVLMIAPIAGIIAVLAPFINPIGLPTNRALLSGLSHSWIFPLIQIAFLNYPQKDRFSIQAYVFLVISPLLKIAMTGLTSAWGTKFFQVASFPITITSLAILGLITVCALILANLQNTVTYKKIL